MSDETKGGKAIDEHRDGLLSDLAGRILRAGADAVSVGAEKLREKGESAASLTARGKEEVMTLLANEIRSYIEKLKVGDEIRSFLDDYTLEVKASVRLKANPPGEEPPAGDDGVSVEVGIEPVIRAVKEPAVEPPPEPQPRTPVQLPAPGEGPVRAKPVAPKGPAKKPEGQKPAPTKQPAPRKKRSTTRKRPTEPKE